MNTITTMVGMRLRSYRQQKGMTQEELAEKAELHPTYIGQAERGEKNLTLVSMEKILAALEISFSEFFKYMETNPQYVTPATQCYELIRGKQKQDQEHYLQILCEIEQLLK